MSNIESPYSEHEVRTTDQAQLFIDTVLAPAADLLAGVSFRESSLYQVMTGQRVSTSDYWGTWTEIGFRAVRLQYEVDPSDILYNVWWHTAMGTDQMPFPKEAVQAAKAAETVTRRHMALENLIGNDASTVEDDEDLETETEGNEEEVVEQKDFFINSLALKPLREVDFAFLSNGSVVYMASQNDKPEVPNPEEECPPPPIAEDDFTSVFDDLDLKIIYDALGHLRLLAP